MAVTVQEINAATFEKSKKGYSAEQVDAFIGWLAQNCDANGTQPPQTVEELQLPPKQRRKREK